jgi:cystathionine beta-lyase
MMNYDFETLIDRTGTGASKWDKMYRKKPKIPAGTVPLSVADMEFVTAPEIAEGLKDYIDRGILGYIYANDAYRDAVCAWMLRRHRWPIDPAWIVPTPGVVPALYHAVRTFTEIGEGVIIMPPVYYPFFSAVKNAGRTLVENTLVQGKGRYEIDFDQLERQAENPATTMLLFCSPHNPVGRVWSPEEIARVAAICVKNKVLLVSDEIHFDLIMPGRTHTVAAAISQETAQNVLVCTAPSKTFNLAGLQTANIIIPNQELRHKFALQFERNFSDWNLPVLGGKACELAYTLGEPWLEALLKKIAENAALAEGFASSHFPAIPASPLEGTYLQWLDFRALGLSPANLEALMVKADVFTDEGSLFGKAGEGFERINLACPTRFIKSALERLAQALSQV